MEFVRKNPGFRTPQISKEIDVPIKTLECWLKQLRNEGKIEFSGSPKTGGVYRVEKKAAMKIVLDDEDAEIEPVPIGGGGWISEAQIDYLSNILASFNQQFGTLFTDADRVSKRIKEDIAPKVAADQGYLNAKKNTPQTARIEHDKVLERVIVSLLKDDTELFKQFFQNESFRRFVSDMVFNLTSG